MFQFALYDKHKRGDDCDEVEMVLAREGQRIERAEDQLIRRRRRRHRVELHRRRRERPHFASGSGDNN